jgi:streptogramin lyase
MPGTSLTRTSLTRTSRAAAAMLVAAAAVLAAPAATAAPRGPLEPTAVPVSTVAAYPDGTFLESVAVGADGAAYVTVALDARIDRVTPAGEVSTFAQFPALGDGSLGFPPTGPSSIVGTVVIAPDSTLYATYVNTAEPELSGVYSVTAQGRRLVTRLPEGSQPNGITVDRDGTIYVADSALGLVWRPVPAKRWCGPGSPTHCWRPPATASPAPTASRSSAARCTSPTPAPPRWSASRCAATAAPAHP